MSPLWYTYWLNSLRLQGQKISKAHIIFIILILWADSNAHVVTIINIGQIQSVLQPWRNGSELAECNRRLHFKKFPLWKCAHPQHSHFSPTTLKTVGGVIILTHVMYSGCRPLINIKCHKKAITKLFMFTFSLFTQGVTYPYLWFNSSLLNNQISESHGRLIPSQIWRTVWVLYSRLASQMFTLWAFHEIPL